MRPKILLLSCCVIFLAWTGCSTAPSLKKSVFETILAPVTKTHPRQSEGDVVALKNGTLLAGWTDFTGGGADHATASIAAATSRDGGRTWSAPYELQPNIGKQNVMSVSFLRAASGDLLFFFAVKNSDSDLRVAFRRSRDEAKTWSAPEIVITEPGYHIMNNGRVVQLKSGRIICPISFYDGSGHHGDHLRNTMFFSDDNGQHWQRGHGIVDCPKRGAMEPGLIELKDGKVLQVIRTQMEQIWFATSSDHGDTWSEPGPFGIVSPESPSTIKRLPKTGELLLVYNPEIKNGTSGMKSRTPLAASISKDEGKTWSKPKLIESDLNFTYAYTSLTFVGDRAVLTYYISPKGISQASLKFKSIPLAWFRE